MKRNIGIALVLVLSMLVVPACSKDKKSGDDQSKSADEKGGGDDTTSAAKVKSSDGVVAASPGAPAMELGAWLKHMPADTEVLLSMNLASLTGTPLWKQYGPAVIAAAGDGFGKANETCGFDPITTLHSVHFGINSSRQEEPVLIVRGISRGPLIQCIKAMATLEKAVLEIADEGNFTIITGDKQDKRQAIGWIDDKTMLLVPEKVDKDYLQARLDGKDGLDGNADFKIPAAKANQSAPVWFAGSFGESSQVAKGMASMGDQPKALYGSVGFEAGIQLAVGVTFADEKAAAATLSKIKPMLGQAKVFMGPAAGLIDKVQLATTGADLTFGLNLTEAEVKQLSSTAGAMLPGF